MSRRERERGGGVGRETQNDIDMLKIMVKWLTALHIVEPQFKSQPRGCIAEVCIVFLSPSRKIESGRLPQIRPQLLTSIFSLIH
jgi:hypothetical protein